MTATVMADRAGWAAYQRAWRQTNKDSGRQPPAHGTNYAYNNYGCHCDRCRAAHAAHAREYRQQAKLEGGKK